MSHSKQTKRGYSLYIEKWDPASKKYVSVCAICGRKGYSPAIEQEDFLRDPKNQAVFRELSKTLNKLQLDHLGRCEVCAGVQDRKVEQ